jgi:MFS family permease
MQREANRLCLYDEMKKSCDDEIDSMLPLILIFLSQFVLGIGNTLFFALGQTYLDDGVTKKKNTPMFLAIVFSLRTFGPAVGFVLGYACLKLYIDPTKTPLIDSKDPRWMVSFIFKKAHSKLSKLSLKI